MWKYFAILMLTGTVHAQVSICGNINQLCLPYTFNSVKNIDSYDSVDVLMVFATVESIFSSEQVDSIADYVFAGKSLYIGADNWPLQAESNMITKRLFNEVFYGNYTLQEAELSENQSLIDWAKDDQIPAGNTTSAFPMMAGLTVEAWISDQPLILVGKYGKGKVIIDGGYSRFYCQHNYQNCEKLFITFLEYLLNM